MKVHTSFWPLHLLRQSSKVPMADLAPGPLSSARAGAATSFVPLQPQGLLPGHSSWIQIHLLPGKWLFCPEWRFSSVIDLGSSLTFSSDLQLAYLGLSLSTCRLEVSSIMISFTTLF